MLSRGSFEQSAGDDSTNLQAGRDIVYHGLSPAEVKEAALAVFRENFIELRGIAEEVALARADKITGEFLSKLESERPEVLENFTDPDLVRATYVAQREYACSGEEDLGQVLVDLLVDRAGERSRNLRTLALNEAIAAAPKLTMEHRQAIGAVFMTRYTRYVGKGGIDDFYENMVRANLVPLAQNLPTKGVDYQHIEYVGAGSISMGELSLGHAFFVGQAGLFTNGFELSQIPQALRDSGMHEKLFMPCMRDPDRWQVRLLSAEDLPRLVAEYGVPEHEQQLRSLMNVGRMSDEEIVSEVLDRVPEVQGLNDAWSSTNLKRLTLTSVGLAIGHAYWRRVTGGKAALSIWL